MNVNKNKNKTVKNLWNRYKKKPSDSLRNELVDHYLPIVKHVAQRLCRYSLPSTIDVDDMISTGVFGLMDAIKSFDLERGLKFETYCHSRIRGAMLDELRKTDWVPRLVRSAQNRIEKATTELVEKLGREPTDRELARKLKIKVAELPALRRQSEEIKLVSLEHSLGGENDNGRQSRVTDTIHNNDCAPDKRINDRENLKCIMRRLNRNERLVIILYYYEDLTMKEIGQTLGLSESRVSQVHSAILEQLRQHGEISARGIGDPLVKPSTLKSTPWQVRPRPDVQQEATVITGSCYFSEESIRNKIAELEQELASWQAMLERKIP